MRAARQDGARGHRCLQQEPRPKRPSSSFARIAAPTPKPLIRPGGPLATLAVGALVFCIRLLPRGFRRALSRGLGAFVYALGIRRKVTLDNLRHAFPERTAAECRAIAFRAYQNLTQTAVDSVCVDQISDAELEATVHVENWGALGDALARGGILTASAHLGSWELFAEVMARRHVKITAVVRPLEGAFNAHIVEGRKAAGVELILQRGAVSNMIKAVRRGRAVVQLIDQSVAADAGVFVPFFGQATCTTPALSMAALRSGAPVYLVLAAREGERLVMHVEGPIAVPEADDRRERCRLHTAALTERIEHLIRRYPEQWLWLHRRWKVRPPEALSAPVEQDAAS